MNDYVLSQSAVKGDEFVLELGCGRGKQSIPLSGLIADGGGCLVSTDISSESVSKVSNILDEINPASEAARIGATVGGRKREKIHLKADELGIRILNRRRNV